MIAREKIPTPSISTKVGFPCRYPGCNHVSVPEHDEVPTRIKKAKFEDRAYARLDRKDNVASIIALRAASEERVIHERVAHDGWVYVADRTFQFPKDAEGRGILTFGGRL
jgi:hypothetical protein